MSYVIRIDRGARGVVWFTWCGEVEHETDAVAFTTAEQAERIRELCGMYRSLRWSTSVVRSKVRK